MISICIPAYKNPDYLRRLLDSLAIQTFKNFEVVISDDSPDGSIEELCKRYACELSMRYFRNTYPFGSPENWNEAVRRSEREWIKIMHDDDWFVDKSSLQVFVNAILDHADAEFFFSAYYRVEPGGRPTEIKINKFYQRSRLKDPISLFASNYIGPPSVTLYRKKNIAYDKRFKWLVDIDFYITYLSGTYTYPVYIDRALVNFGVSEEQITQECFRNPAIEIPEYFLLLEKVGTVKFKNFLVFDAWWRIVRNFKISDQAAIRAAGYTGCIHPLILTIILWQRMIPDILLKIGFFSKLLAGICYLFNK